MRSRTFDVPCTIELVRTPDHFHAHLTLDGSIEVGPGDRVRVHGEPIRLAFGESRIERRRATVMRAGLLLRAWTKIKARFALQELYEVSFTPTRTL